MVVIKMIPVEKTRKKNVKALTLESWHTDPNAIDFELSRVLLAFNFSLVLRPTLKFQHH